MFCARFVSFSLFVAILYVLFALLGRVLKYSSGIRISLGCNFDCHLNKTKASKDSIDITLRPTKKQFAEHKISPAIRDRKGILDAEQ
jgi:hypothetical protein